MGNHQQLLNSRQTKNVNSEESHSQQEGDHLNPVYQGEQEKKWFSSEKNIVDALCHLVKQQSAPDIDVFDENPLDFHYFMTLFHEVVEKIIDDPRGGLTKWRSKRDYQLLCKGTTNCMPPTYTRSW